MIETRDEHGPVTQAVERNAVSREDFFAGRLDVDDPRLRTKLYELPRIISEWLEPFGGLENKRVLDFGCGFGETAAGIAMGYGAADVHGVDIQSKPDQCEFILARVFGTSGLPANLRFSQIPETGPTEREAYDVVVSWSAVEHVSRASLSKVLSALHGSLIPEGLAFIQISPLYFSPEGSHLWPVGYRRWEHLTKQTSEVLDDIANCDGVDAERKARLVRLFKTLNRLTANDLVRRCEDAGFRVLREQRDRTTERPPKDLEDAYTLDALLTHQIVLLLQRV